MFSENGRTFEHFDYSKYATDASFQEANHPPSLSSTEAKAYFIIKHKLCVLKTEAFVLTKGFSVFSSTHVPGGCAEIILFRKHIELCQAALEKLRNEISIEDHSERFQIFPKQRAILTGKLYWGLAQSMRAVVSTKVVGELLSGSQKRRNEKISTDRVIVENIFGRETSLWRILNVLFKLAED